MFEKRRWLVIPTTELHNVDFDQVLESSMESCRLSLDGTKTFVKYDINIVENTYIETHIDPETCDEVNTVVQAGVYGRPSVYNETYPEYTHSEILVLLSTSDWSNNETIE